MAETLKNGTRIKITAIASFGRGKKVLRIFECREYDGDKPVSTKYVNVLFLQEKEIIKTTSQTKQAEKWLNTEDGIKFFRETPNTKLPI